jgi:riboflavin synthase
MFTGLVETKTRVLTWETSEDGKVTLSLAKPEAWDSLETGESIAVNGCCLTLLDARAESLSFNLLQETIRVTGFREIKEGDSVNLERSLLPTSRMGGHFVSGHIDTTGTVLSVEPRGADTLMTFSHETKWTPYLLPKGSIAVDGVSLTVFEVGAGTFSVWLIPHTLAVTRLGDLRPGQAVNLEFDLLAKYVERLLDARSS